MITLEYFDGTEWIDCGSFFNEEQAWISLGGDDQNYRTKDENDVVLTDNSSPASTPKNESYENSHRVNRRRT